MDMWCPYGIGRESWDREVLRLVDPNPSPLKGERCRRIGPHRIIVVVVVVVSGRLWGAQPDVFYVSGRFW